MAVNSKLITYQESLAMPESKEQEIVNGELRRMPPPNIWHARVIQRLYDILNKQLDPRTVEVLVSCFGLRIRHEPFTYRIPDLGVFLESKMVVRDDIYVCSAPELIVEAVSPANRKGDLDELLLDYQTLCVPEVWFLYLDRRLMRRLALREGRFHEVQNVSQGPIALPGFPDVRVNVEELWSVLPASYT